MYSENGDVRVNLSIVFRTRNKCDSRWNIYLHCWARYSCENTISPCTWTRQPRRCSQSNSGAALWWPSSPHTAATLKHNVLTLKLRTSRSYWITPPPRPAPRGAKAPCGAGPLHYRGFTVTLGGTPLDDWSARRRDLYLATHNTHNKHPHHRWDSNRQSQQASVRTPTPQTALTLVSPLY